ncbi:unnamed protein product [Rhodiola kirilowii]
MAVRRRVARYTSKKESCFGGFGSRRVFLLSSSSAIMALGLRRMLFDVDISNVNGHQGTVRLRASVWTLGSTLGSYHLHEVGKSLDDSPLFYGLFHMISHPTYVLEKTR